MKTVDQKTLHYGSILLHVYDFKTANTLLPMHNHLSGGEHVSTVVRGSFEVRGEGWTKTLKSGDILDIEKHINHEFESLEDDSRLINIIK